MKYLGENDYAQQYSYEIFCLALLFHVNKIQENEKIRTQLTVHRLHFTYLYQWEIDVYVRLYEPPAAQNSIWFYIID